ncbi:MAG: hypothetical protein COA58_03930 [Bacteroidetes bacterium]|nr:MAG: hypothetical protein COA58_03930 [Bacteroidota bacterium]
MPHITSSKNKMKKINYTIAILALLVSACTGVDSGHRGVEVSWGGETNKETVYPEGLSTGVHWLWDDMIQYDIREKTMSRVFEFNDNNNMTTTVELALDYNLNPDKVNLLHMKITDVETKILKTLKSAGKEVVPQYSAVELNITKRAEAEKKLAKIMSEELPEFYVEFARIQMTDVDIPVPVAKLAEETAVQLGKNKLAEKKEAEQAALAKAKVATAQGNFDAAVLDAKTKKLLSTPAILKLKQLDIDMTWARSGKSKYGENNIFGAGTTVIKGLK